MHTSLCKALPQIPHCTHVPNSPRDPTVCLKEVGSSKSENEGTRKWGNTDGAEASTQLEMVSASRRKEGKKQTREFKGISSLGQTVLHTSAPPKGASLCDRPEQQLTLLQMPWVTKKRCNEALGLPPAGEGTGMSERPPPQAVKAKTQVQGLQPSGTLLC